MCLPGPAPPLDLSRYLHVSGFPSAARTDAVMRPLKAVNGLERTWFHWIDDTSGVAECQSAEGARSLLEAAAAAIADAAATALAPASEPSRVVDPEQLLLEDMKIVELDDGMLYGPRQDGDDGGSKERGTKRPRQEAESTDRKAADNKMQNSKAAVNTMVI